MIIVAKDADLSLPEFLAFNEGQDLPRMRRWELPFALFRSRPADASSVLDLSLGAGPLRERLARLFPHVRYTHRSPLQGGKLSIPAGGEGGETYDRVVCVNTLERLPAPAREALAAEMGRRLRPGGLLVVTAQCRPDGSATGAGGGGLSPADLLALCARHDLHPLGEEAEEPSSAAGPLYLSDDPSPLACFGGVFYKTERPAFAPGKKIVLSLLTWNKCDVSVDSLWAYAAEARMLQRMGHTPLICVCDNGSVDGTQEALREIDPLLDIPHRFILNAENRGSSVARNQVIDYMLEEGADYLLFMDGDIEVVPFSSFAMMRYMERAGAQLGCVGADFREHAQTLHRELASTSFYSIDARSVITSSMICPTQYGLFRREPFAEGVRFEDGGPFGGAGWGFEDNDLAFQMVARRYLIQGFQGMVYLHRAAGSSVKIMRDKGDNPDVIFERRRQFMLDKWEGVPAVSKGPLEMMRKIVFPHREKQTASA